MFVVEEAVKFVADHTEIHTFCKYFTLTVSGVLQWALVS